MLLLLGGLQQIALAQTNNPSSTLRITLREVQFTAEHTTIRSQAGQALNEVVALMDAMPTVKVEVRAHTDPSGSAAYNLKLSRKRAVAVRFLPDP